VPAATPVRIVVWDNIGNTLLGVRPWSAWDDRQRTRLIEENAQAEAHAPAFDQLFAEAGFQPDLIWLYDPDRLGAGFGSLLEDYAGRTRPFTDPAEFPEIARDADIIVIHKETLPAEAIADTPRLRAVLHLGQDYRGVPSDALRARKIPIAATPLVNYIAVAEHVWAFILNHVKKLPGERRYMDTREYVTSWGLFPGTENVRDLTLGLLGFGEIARPIARVARAFDMRTLYWDVRRFPELEERYGVEYVGWDDLFAQVDVLSVQLALNPQTHGIIGARELALMKPTALFINTARGKLVDQPALTAAVQTRQIGALALDVYAEEPLPPDDPLLALHADPSYDVTLTPHSAWQSPWTWIRDSQALWHDAIHALKGEPMKYEVERRET
jgi:phosphoglycerate dehydrogenase-like enzyme